MGCLKRPACQTSKTRDSKVVAFANLSVMELGLGLGILQPIWAKQKGST